MKLKFDRAREEDLPTLNDLYNRVFDANRSMDQFKWEFREGPYGPATQYVLRDEKGEARAHWGVLPNYFVCGNRSLKAGKVENTMIDPDLRGQGHYGKFERESIKQVWNENYDAIWNSLTTASGLRKRTGFSMVGNLVYLFRPLRGRGANLSYYLQKTFRRVLGDDFTSGLTKRVTSITPDEKPGYEARQVSVSHRSISGEESIRVMEQLSSGKQGLVTMMRDAEYMRWRFLNNPHLSFQFEFLEDEKDQGVLIWHQKREEIVIDDFWWSGIMTPELIEAVYFSVRKTWLKQKGAHLVSFLTLEHSEFYLMLRKSGFVPVGNNKWVAPERHFLIYPNPSIESDLQEKLMRSEHWMISNIITEGIR